MPMCLRLILPKIPILKNPKIPLKQSKPLPIPTPIPIQTLMTELKSTATISCLQKRQKTSLRIHQKLMKRSQLMKRATLLTLPTFSQETPLKTQRAIPTLLKRFPRMVLSSVRTITETLKDSSQMRSTIPSPKMMTLRRTLIPNSVLLMKTMTETILPIRYLQKA